MVSGEDALHLALADRGRRVAADGAARADRRHVLDVPRPSVEAVERRGERADRAELDHVAGERRAVRLVLEGRDLRVGPAIPRDELTVLRDVLREPCAAVAEDAALAVERDERRDRDRLVERVLLEASSACCPGPWRNVRSWSGHSPPLSQTGQSSGWFTRMNSSVASWPSAAFADVALVLITMSGATVSVQAACSFGAPSISTRHIRHAPTGGPSRGS
jgi:hypothetical protein